MKLWVSICSAHQSPKEDCDLCQTGWLEDVWRLKASSFFHKYFLRLWLWWMNRPNSRAKRRLREIFPNLEV